MINNALKKIVSVKTENILFILYIFYMIINIGKANNDFIISAIILHLVLLIGVYLTTRLIRQELKEYVSALDPIILIDFRAIKKEIFNKVFNHNRPRLKLNSKSFLNNSI